MNEKYNEYINRHLSVLSFRDLADSTISSYMSYLNQFLVWLSESLQSKDLSDLTWDDLRLYFGHLKDDRKLANSTINAHIAQLCDFWEYILKRPWDKKEIPYMRVDEKLPAVPTVDEINMIINSISNLKHKAEIALLYSSGIRISELSRLKCGDILTSKNCIFIAKTKNRSERYAVLSEKALGHLKNYVRSVQPPLTKEDHLFPGEDRHRVEVRNKGISPQSVRNVLDKACDRCSMSEKGYTLHSLRHAFGLHLYDAGTDLIYIKEAMGHKSLSSTEIYLKLGIGNGRNVVSPYDL